MPNQQTLANIIRMEGIGLHSGLSMKVTLYPAPIHFGIRFRRVDLPDRPEIPALLAHQCESVLATTLRLGNGIVGTVEHLLAALAALEIDNALVEVDGPEVPVLDGSALGWTQAIRQAGSRELPAGRRRMRILKRVSVSDGDRSVEILPGDDTLNISCNIDFPSPVIGKSSRSLRLTAYRFEHEIAPARTFGFLHDVERLHEAGLALGGSLANAIVIGDDGILNPEGLRFPDEFVRHKVLDIVGDMALLGYPVAGRVIANRSGHALHVALAQAILADPSCYRIEETLSRQGYYQPEADDAPTQVWAV